MKAELEELAEMSKRATEREIETEVVHIFKQIGWPRSQINQDVPISDKGADKGYIVLRLDGAPIILVEVKKHGQLRDADNQVNRYCRLLRPSPKLAFLTDGIHWTLYYVGQIGAISVQEASVPQGTASVASMLTAFNPENISTLLQAGAFHYLDIVEEGLQQRSEDTQRQLRHFFISTVKALLMSSETEVFRSSLSITASQNQPVLPKEADKVLSIVKSNQQPIPFVEYSAFQPPTLKFTTLLAARFAGNTASNWNDLLRAAVRSTLDNGQTIQDIRRTTSINLQEGSVVDKGYAPVEGTDLSLQGMTADESWQNALKLAQKVGCSVEAEFRWQDKEKAAHPGESGSLRWQP